MPTDTNELPADQPVPALLAADLAKPAAVYTVDFSGFHTPDGRNFLSLGAVDELNRLLAACKALRKAATTAIQQARMLSRSPGYAEVQRCLDPLRTLAQEPR